MHWRRGVSNTDIRGAARQGHRRKVAGPAEKPVYGRWWISCRARAMVPVTPVIDVSSDEEVGDEEAGSEKFGK